jgi:hypothetical protein
MSFRIEWRYQAARTSFIIEVEVENTIVSFLLNMQITPQQNGAFLCTNLSRSRGALSTISQRRCT